MDPVFSPRSTGACPLCKKQAHCVIRRDIEAALAAIPEEEETKQLELVIYVCPSFVETA